MPERQRVKKLPSPAVQGADSWVQIKAITVGEAKKLQRLNGAGESEIDRASRELMSEYVLDWNWVDDAGEPLPKPNANPDIFDLLTPAEIQFIAGALGGGGGDDKKK